MLNAVEVVIDSVRVSLTSQQRIVVLREVDNERYLPIWIGPYEAESITIALQEVEVARPLTHDLLKNMINALNARVLRVEVLALRDDVFYGNIVLEIDGNEMSIDSRPSDALALAVRTHVPIQVSREVMEAAGIIPEKDIQDQKTPPSDTTTSAEPLTQAGEERLSVFEDFLEKLDLDDSLDEEEDDKGK
jgi:bifunctional DNase/RNase